MERIFNSKKYPKAVNQDCQQRFYLTGRTRRKTFVLTLSLGVHTKYIIIDIQQLQY